MPTYEYECLGCGRRFEQEQKMTDPPLGECPGCKGAVHRLLSAGGGFIVRESGHGHAHADEGCSLETTGTTCCGREQRCSKPPCR